MRTWKGYEITMNTTRGPYKWVASKRVGNDWENFCGRSLRELKDTILEHTIFKPFRQIRESY